MPSLQVRNASVRYVEETCIPEERLAEAVGIGASTLDRLRAFSCVPVATYRIFRNGSVTSAVRTSGTPSGAGRTFYSPAVIWWLRRAAELVRSREADNLAPLLQDWLKKDLEQALVKAGGDAAQNGWSHIVSTDGAVGDGAKLEAEVQTIWTDWMSGAWAVCLRRFDGHHLVTKEIERARIARLTEDGQAPNLSSSQRLELLDAISRLDSVMLPFAPHERPHGTPGSFIDAIVERYRLPGLGVAYDDEMRIAC